MYPILQEEACKLPGIQMITPNSGLEKIFIEYVMLKYTSFYFFSARDFEELLNNFVSFI